MQFLRLNDSRNDMLISVWTTLSPLISVPPISPPLLDMDSKNERRTHDSMERENDLPHPTLRSRTSLLRIRPSRSREEATPVVRRRLHSEEEEEEDRTISRIND